MPSLDFLESKAWWEQKTRSKALDSATGLFSYFHDRDKDRLSAYNGYSRIYLNRDIDGADYLSNYSAAWNFEDNAYSRVPINLAKTIVDAVHSRVTKQNPRPVFVTKGGNFTLQKKAKQMQHWVEYCEHFTDLRPTKKAAALDGFIYGNGFVKTCPHPVIDEVTNGRIHPADIFIDPMEASANANPTQLYQRAFVSRSRLMKMFDKPADRDYIRRAGRISEDDTYKWRRQDNDLQTVVEVVEGWRLPSYDGAGDGKHIIFVEGRVLVLDEWENMVFPFSCYRWKEDPTVGFWGISLVEELLGVHFDFNHTITNVEECIDSMPTPFILVPEGGTVSVGQLGNVNGTIINYSDRPPTFQLSPSVPADVTNYAQAIWEKGLAIGRLVSLSLPETTGNGFGTGQAIRDFNDIQSTELAPQYEAFERFNVHVYEQQVRAGREIYDRNPAFTIVARKDKYTIEDIDWSAIDDPRRDSFIIQVFPASMLSQTPAGRKSDVLDYFNAGWLDVGEAMSLLDFPDLDRFRNLRDANRQNLERILELILDEGQYTPPEPTLDLRLAMKMTQMYINRAQAMSVPEDRVSMLRQFMRQVHTLLQKSDEATRMQAEGIGPGLAGGPPAVGPDGAAPTAI